MKTKYEPPKRDYPPLCQVHDGVAVGTVQIKWNGKLLWVCQTCLDGKDK